MPALIYFSLSAEASISLDPYNQPVAFLSPFPMRVFSFDLPFHHTESDFLTAMEKWSKSISEGIPLISNFVEKVQKSIDYLVDLGYIDPQKIAVAGLSRGGFVAAHLAAIDPRIQTVLGFAPLTEISYPHEFAHLNPKQFPEPLNLSDLIPKLIHKNVRFYIGNRDIRVGTSQCFNFIKELVEANYHAQVRSPPVELFITPSKGMYGHGTLPPIFKDGALWVLEKLLGNSVT